MRLQGIPLMLVLSLGCWALIGFVVVAVVWLFS